MFPIQIKWQQPLLRSALTTRNYATGRTKSNLEIMAISPQLFQAEAYHGVLSDRPTGQV